WQTVGSDMYARFVQRSLDVEYRSQGSPWFAEAPTVPSEPDAVLTSTAPQVLGAPHSNPGEPIARISIPAIDLDWVVVWGTDLEHLKKGPGWYPESSFFGEPGNAAIAGHRTTYGAPFNRIDELKTGDRITVSVDGRPDVV